MDDDGGVSWVWLLPLGLAAGATGGLWAALRYLRRELAALSRATSTLVEAAEEARLLRAPEGR